MVFYDLRDVLNEQRRVKYAPQPMNYYYNNNNMMFTDLREVINERWQYKMH